MFLFEKFDLTYYSVKLIQDKIKTPVYFRSFEQNMQNMQNHRVCADETQSVQYLESAMILVITFIFV